MGGCGVLGRKRELNVGGGGGGRGAISGSPSAPFLK